MSPEDDAMKWDDIDTDTVRRMIAESDAEGGEIPFEEVARRLAARAAARERRR